jgi:hypothetical protein
MARAYPALRAGHGRGLRRRGAERGEGLFAHWPLLTLVLRNVTRLAEMCADDTTARRSGRPALITALLAPALLGTLAG